MTKKEDLKVGQRWYVRLPGGTTLASRDIVELTEETVVLEDYEALTRYNTGRYLTGDVEFIEAH
ncbi:MAG: hypothetical protein V3U75_01500 [Methylococcaceae bacterium]